MTTALVSSPMPGMFGLSGTFRVFRRWTGIELIDRICTALAQKFLVIRSRAVRKDALRLEMAYVCRQLEEHYRGLHWYAELGAISPAQRAAYERLLAATPVLQAHYRRLYEAYLRLLPPPPPRKKLEVMYYKEGDQLYEMGFLETLSA